MRNWDELKQMVGMPADDEDYDINWLKQMIKHHESAVKMSKQALSKAEHQELKDLANEIIKSQSAQITKMKAWVKDWAKEN
jgi:uncharacterized protein (DUF305 family)